MDEKILFVWQFIFGVFELKIQFKKKKKNCHSTNNDVFKGKERREENI